MDREIAQIHKTGRGLKRFRELLPKFETRQQAHYRKRVLTRQLDGGDDAAVLIARRLDACSKHAPCASPICPVCVRGLRRSFIKGGMACVADICRMGNVPGEHVIAFSAVLGEEQYAVGQLHKADLLQVNKRLQRRFQRAELPIVLAGVDISYNEDSHSRRYSG